MKRLGIICLVLLSLIPAVFMPKAVFAAEEREVVRIGVLAHKGYDYCLQSWTPTAQYLSSEIPHSTFEIVPLKFEEVNPSVQERKVDFIIANSSIYVELEIKYWVTAIATM